MRKKLLPWAYILLLLYTGCSGNRGSVSKKQSVPQETHMNKRKEPLSTTTVNTDGFGMAATPQSTNKEARISRHEVVMILDSLVKNKKSLWFFSSGACQDYDLVRSFETGGQIRWRAERTITNDLTCKRTTSSYQVIFGPEESELMVSGPTSHTDDLEGCVRPDQRPVERPIISTTRVSIANCLARFRIDSLEKDRLLLRSYGPECLNAFPFFNQAECRQHKSKCKEKY